MELVLAGRRAFKPYRLRSQRFAVLVAHRRCGKTVACVQGLIDKSTTLTREHGRYAYVGPYLTQAKEVAWEYLKRFAKPIIASKNESELWIETVQGHRIRIHGADKPDRLRGAYLDGVVLDEYADMRPSVYGSIIRPMLADRLGWATFIGTPKGRNSFFDIWKSAQDDPRWFTAMLRASETGLISAGELADAGKDMTPEEYAQEFECFPSGALVSTTRGHVPIEAVRTGDSVLTHRGRWRPVTRTMQRDFDGEVVSIRAFGSSAPLRSTPEHPVRVYRKETASYEWVEASEVAVGDCVFLPAPKQATQAISGALACVIAWYITEGCVSGNSVTFCLNPTKPAESERVRGYLRECGFEPASYSPGSVSVCSVALADQLVAWCGCLAENKRVPFDLIGGHEELFFQELMLGDGCLSQPVKGGHCWLYTTISRGLAFDVQILAGMMGRRAGICERPGGIMTSPNNGKEYPSAISYQVRIPHGIKVNHSRAREAFPVKLGTAYRVREVSRESYRGQVFNLSVKEDESYVVEGRAVHNCSFDAAIQGAYYGKEIAEAERAGRVCEVAREPSAIIQAAWDLGIGDSTAIWVFQCVGSEVRVLDAFENSGFGLEWYVEELRRRGWGSADTKHWLPHDAKARDLTTGRSRVEFLISLGLKCDLVPNLGVDDGISAARMLMPQVWFNKGPTDEGVEALRQYRTEYNEKTKAFNDGPRHDWTSHYADAYRYMSIVAREQAKPEVAKPKPIAVPLTDLSHDQFFEIEDTPTRRERV